VIGFDESKKILTRMSEVKIGPSQKLVYGTDGNMGNTLRAGLPPGLLNGMKGTRPETKLPAAFTQRLKADDPKLADISYAGEAYDAVMIVALAAERAKSTEGVDIASEINGIMEITNWATRPARRRRRSLIAPTAAPPTIASKVARSAAA
jgi:branched-chain amino acid transport system substrate-binding protein